MPRALTQTLITEFMERVNKQYKGKIVETGGRFSALKLSRFSSGVLSLDAALGGGWPFGRINIIVGYESTGKTLLALKAIEQVEKTCHNCRKFETECICGDFIPGVALFVDVEGAFDLDWAKVNGFNDDWHIVARSEYAEQAIDIIDAAVRSKAFDLIILDSIAALTPTKEIEETTENWQIGLAARLVNKALRKWIASFNAVAQDGKREGPCILALNQFRINVGQMFGDNRTAPGGQGQRFASSIRIYTKSTKIIDDPESKETAYAQLSGVIHKNKTFVSMLEYSFQLAVRDTERYKKGDIDNDAELVRQGKKYGLCKKIGGGFGYDIITAANEKAFQDKLLEQPKLARKLWKEIILAATT